MSWQYTSYTLLLLATAAISAGLALYALRRRGVPGAKMGALFMGAVSLWATANAVQLGLAAPAANTFWSMVGYLGIVVAPPAWLGFAAGYTGRERWLDRRNVALLSVVPALTVVAVFTNGAHHMFWTSATQEPSAPYLREVSYGVLFWIWCAYAYVLLLAGAVLVVSMLWRSGNLYSKQGGALLFGVTAPWLGNVLYLSGASPLPDGLDITPFCLLFTGAAMTLAVSRFGLLEVVPVARAAVVEEMEDGVIVVDSRNRVLDMNPAARLLSAVPISRAVGMPLDHVVSNEEVLRLANGSGGARGQVRIGEGEARRDYEVTVSALQKHRRREAVRFLVVRDVTERVSRELLFRLLVENASDVIAIYDATGAPRYVSPSIERVLGYESGGALAALADPEMIHPEDRAWVWERREKVRSRPGEHPSIVFRVRHKDGSWRYMEGVTNNLRADPDVRGVVASWRDATERVEAEGEVRRLNDTLQRRVEERTAELEKSEAKYRAIFENAVEGIFQSTAEGKLVTANPAMARIFGYASPEELLSSVTDVAGQLYANPGRREGFGKAMRERGAVSGFEVEVVRKDGGTAWVSVGARALRDASGGIVGYEGGMEDITDRIRARRTLERRVAALTRLASNLTAGQPVESTLDAVTVGVTEETAAVACSVTLLDPESERLLLVAARNLPEGYMDALSAAWRSGGRSLVAKPLESLEPGFVRGARGMFLEEPLYSPLHPFLWEAGWEGVFVVPLVSRGQALGVISAYYPPGEEPAEDERTFIGAVADQAAVAVENARYFERFLTAASGRAVLEERQRISRELHDSVSQALYGIALGSRTARTLLDRDPARAVEPLEYVLSLSEAGLAEMRALIFELRPEALESEGLISALEKQAAALRARHEINVRTSLGEEPALPPEAKEALYRIAQEALQNTIKHAGAANVDLGIARVNGSVTLDISDDGTGFDPAEAFPGHLGLKSMRERVEQLGGTLRIESAPGEGTRIRVRISP